MPTAPNTDNYSILKAIVSFQLNSTGEFRDLGNVPELEFSPEYEKLAHFSSRAGVKKKDKEVVVSQSWSVRLVMDEITAPNMAMTLGGTLSTDSDGNQSFGVGSVSSVEGVLRAIGQNEIGQKVNWIGTVQFSPSGSFNFLSDEWATVEVSGEVLADGSGNFGIMTIVEPVSA